MNLSDLDPSDVQLVSPAPAQPQKAQPSLKLSDLSPSDISVVPPQATPATSPVTAATTGVANGASMGFAPALGAIGKTAMDAITGVSGPLAGGSLDDLIDEYRSQRDALKSSFAKAAAAHPSIATAGNIIGGGATMGGIGPAAMSTGGLAATGAATGLGNSNADLTKAIQDPSQAVQAAKDAGTGALTSLVVGKTLGGLMGKTGETLSPDSTALTDTAETAAVRSMNPIKSQMKNMMMKDQVTGPNGVGRALLDNGGVTPFATLADKQAAMSSLQESSGQAIGDTMSTLDQMGAAAPSPGDLAKEVQNQALPLQNIKTAQPTYNALQDVGSDIGTLGDSAPDASNLPGGYQQAQDIKGFVGDQVERAGGWNGPNPSEKNLALRDVYHMINGKIEEGAEAAAKDSGDEDLLNNYLQAKSDYGNAKTAGKILNGSTASEASNNKIGLTSTIVGAGELATGNPVKAAVTMGAWQAAKAYGNNFVALSADKLADVVQNNPSVFGAFSGALKSAAARGGTSLAATDYILQQTNQDYRSKRNHIFNPGQQVNFRGLANQGK